MQTKLRGRQVAQGTSLPGMRSILRSLGRCLQETSPSVHQELFVLINLSTRRRCGRSMRSKGKLGLNQRSRKPPPLRWLHFVLPMRTPHKVFLEQHSLNFIKKFKNALERSIHLSPMFYGECLSKGALSTCADVTRRACDTEPSPSSWISYTGMGPGC